MEMILKNIKITDDILKNISNQGCYGLTVLIQQWKNEEKAPIQKPQQNKTSDNSQLIEKINKSIESLDNQLQKLSGNHLTNTYKRMNEEANRESKRESFRFDINMLEYIKERIVDNQVTELEKALISGIFRDEIHYHYSKKYTYKPCSASTLTNDVEYPKINLEYDKNNWWNIEVPKKQKRLQKAGINNTEQLIKAVEEYKIIVELIDKPISPTIKKIKQLTSEYKMRQKGDVNFTPLEVVERMIQFAMIDGNSKVLEPSAGIGNIADKIKEVTEHVDCLESSPSFQELLKLKGYNVVGWDFLTYEKYGYYDSIIMNPPFSNNQDITHLKHAYKLLKNDGVLVCITSPHWQFANDRTSQEFRNWIDEKNYNVVELPSGTFEMTGVSSRIIIINKMEEVLENAI
jgi:protein-L-isoaspartate O-methyltransferase